MFDISFTELMLIGVVALVVIGPERLPKVARTAGHLLGRLQRYVSDVKTDIQREMQLDELKKLQGEMQQSAREIETSVRTQVSDLQSSVENSSAAARSSIAELESQFAGNAVTPEAPGGDAKRAAAPSPQLELGLSPGSRESGKPG